MQETAEEKPEPIVDTATATTEDPEAVPDATEADQVRRRRL